MKFGRNSITEKSGKYYEGKESKTQKKNQKGGRHGDRRPKPDESALEKIEKVVKYLLGMSCPHGVPAGRDCPECRCITVLGIEPYSPPVTVPPDSHLRWENLKPTIARKLASVDPVQAEQGVRMACTTIEKATMGKGSSEGYYQTLVDHLNTLQPHNDAQQAGIAIVRETVQALSREHTIESSSGSSGTGGSR